MLKYFTFMSFATYGYYGKWCFLTKCLSLLILTYSKIKWNGSYLYSTSTTLVLNKIHNKPINNFFQNNTRHWC